MLPQSGQDCGKLRSGSRQTSAVRPARRVSAKFLRIPLRQAKFLRIPLRLRGLTIRSRNAEAGRRRVAKEPSGEHTLSMMSYRASPLLYSLRPRAFALNFTGLQPWVPPRFNAAAAAAPDKPACPTGNAITNSHPRTRSDDGSGTVVLAPTMQKPSRRPGGFVTSAFNHRRNQAGVEVSAFSRPGIEIPVILIWVYFWRWPVWRRELWRRRSF